MKSNENDIMADLYMVPDIVHFIWFNEDHNKPRQMHFLHYISIFSAHKIQKPLSIMLHCNSMPRGQWWQRLRREVPMNIVHLEPPEFIYGQKLKHMYHQADVARYETLLKYGGIYLDYDVIVLNSMDPLRLYETTLGKELPAKFIAGIIAAAPNARFLKLWRESYKDKYRPDEWDYNSASAAYALYKKYPELLHVEPYKLTTPDYLDRADLLNNVVYWEDLYVIHVMGHELNWDKFNPEYIKNVNTTLGEVMRYIYYGSKQLIQVPQQ